MSPGSRLTPKNGGNEPWLTAQLKKGRVLGLIRNIYAKTNYFAKKIFQKLDLSLTVVLERFVGAYTIMDKCG